MQTFRVVDLGAVVQASKSKAGIGWDVADVVAEMQPYLLTEAASLPPEDVAALNFKVTTAQAEARHLREELGKLREGLRLTLGLAETPSDVDLAAVVEQTRLAWADRGNLLEASEARERDLRLSLEGSRNAVKALELDRAEAVKALGLRSVDVGHLATAIKNRFGGTSGCSPDDGVAALRAELAKLKADKLALETAMAQERELLSDLGNDLDADPETRVQAWVGAYTLDWVMDPEVKAPSKRLPLTAAGLHLSPEGTVVPPAEDVEALRLDLANAQAELGRMGGELGKLRGDLQVALGLSGMATDEELVAAADRPTPAEYAALQASLKEARAAEKHWQSRAEARTNETFAREQEVRRARERAETAEAACRRLDVQNKAEVANAEAMRERAERAEADLNRANDQIAQHEAVMATARPLAPVLDAADARESELRKRAEMTERLLAASRRDAASLREELATVNARVALKAEMDASFAERYENARREMESVRLRAEKAESKLWHARHHLAELWAELGVRPNASDQDALARARVLRGVEAAERSLRESCSRLEAQADSLDTRARAVELANTTAQLEVAQVERDRARAAAEELRQQLAGLQTDRRHTAADALRKRLAEHQDAVRRLKATIVMMAVERAELLTLMGGTQKDGEAKVQPAPEGLQCHGSGAPLGPLDGRGRYRCPECDFSTPVTPKALEALPAHQPLHACGEAP